MKLIKFRRLNRPVEIRASVAIRRFEIAFNERHLHAKLDGEMAEIHMPAKGVLTRLWRKVFPLQGISAQADGQVRTYQL